MTTIAITTALRGLDDVRVQLAKLGESLKQTGNAPQQPMRGLSALMQEGMSRLRAYAAAAGPAGRVLIGMGGAGLGAAAAVGGLTLIAKAGVSAWAEYERQMLRIDGVLKATSQSSGLTRKEIVDLSEQIEKSTMQSAEGAMAAASILLTFRSVAGDTFKETLKVAADMASVMGTSITGAAMQMGRAMEDPVRGLTMLRRSGVSFTEAQKEQIKALVDTGKLLEAQKLILAEVSKQVGGVAGAERGGLSGSIKGLSDAWGDLMKAVGQSISDWKVLQTTFGLISSSLDKITNEVAPSTEKQIKDLGQTLQTLYQRLGKQLESPFAIVRQQTDATRQEIGKVQQQILDIESSTQAELERARQKGMEAEKERASQLTDAERKALEDRQKFWQEIHDKRLSDEDDLYMNFLPKLWADSAAKEKALLDERQKFWENVQNKRMEQMISDEDVVADILRRQNEEANKTAEAESRARQRTIEGLTDVRFKGLEVAGTMHSAFGRFFASIVTSGQTGTQKLKAFFGDLTSTILNEFGRIAASQVFKVLFGMTGASGGPQISGGGGLLGGLVSSGAAAVGGFIGSGLGPVGSFLGSTVGGFLGKVFGGFFQTGGRRTFTRPSLIAVAERGPEEVMARPLASGGGRGGAGVTVAFNGMNILSDIDMARLERVLVRAVAGSRRRVV